MAGWKLPWLTLGIALALAVPAPAAARLKTFTLRFGPVAMGAFNVSLPRGVAATPGVDGYIVGMHADLVDRRGRPVTIRDVMLHHVVFSRQRRAAVRRECGGGVAEVFYGTGEENQRLRLPAGYGYRIGRGDRWRMKAMLMSHSLRSLDVYVRYRVTVQTGSRLTPGAPVLAAGDGLPTSGGVPARGRWSGRIHEPAQLRVACALQRADRSRRRPPARRRQGHVALPAALSRPAPAGHASVLRVAGPPLLPRAPHPPRTRPRRHALLPLAHRHSHRAGRDPAAQRRV